MLKRGVMLACLVLVACGGQTAPLTITNVSDDPEAGSPECVLANGECVLCNDGNWHCGAQTLPQCPYSPPRTACPSPTDFTQCMTCAGGTSVQWSCQPTTIGLDPPIGWVKIPAPSASCIQ